MLEIIKKHPGYFIGAVLVHIIFLAIFTVRFHLFSQQRASSTQPQTVKVTTVDEQQVQKELKSFKAADERERQRAEQLRRQREAEEKKLAAARAKRQAEQKLETQRKAEAAARQKLQLEKQQAEARRKALARKQQQEEERRQRAENEKALKQQLAAEEKRMQAEQQAAAERRAAQQAKQSEIDKYMNLIENRIYQNWVKPPGIDKGLKCVLEVKLLPGGEVIEIQVSKSSGDPVYDQSVVAAVRRASPLPVPSSDSGLFDDFRNLTLPVQADKKI